MEKEFEEWYQQNERRFHCGHFDEKQIAYSAWIEGRNRALSMSGVSEWISVETPPHDQETVLLIDSYNQTSTGYFHGPKSGFIWDAPDLHDPIKWKRILK